MGLISRVSSRTYRKSILPRNSKAKNYQILKNKNQFTNEKPKWNSTHENAPPPADSLASKTTPLSKSTSLTLTKLDESPAIMSLTPFAEICDEWANLMMLLTDWLRMTELLMLVIFKIFSILRLS